MLRASSPRTLLSACFALALSFTPACECDKAAAPEGPPPAELKAPAPAEMPAAPGEAAPRAAKGEGPNVVLIILDTLRADMMSTYGFKAETSPELTRLADAGVKFERAISPSSWTRPSIGTIVTGHYPRTLGIYRQRDQILNDRFHTLSEILHDRGYATYGRTANPNINTTFNFHQGFDTYVDSHVVYGWMKPSDPSLNQSHNRLADAAEIYRSALEWVDEQAKAGRAGPAYLQLDVMEMHDYYRGKNSLTRPEFKGLFKRQRHPKYLQALRQLSMDTGAFVDALKSRPGWDDTLFVLVSDHGEGLSDHPDVPDSRYHGTVVYESNVRVPFILYNPAWTPEVHSVERPVRVLDLVPTVLDYLKVPAPEPLPGVSLLPLTRGEEVTLPEYFITESQFVGRDKIGAYGGDWKYIENRDKKRGVNPEELQAKGYKENGRKTDQIGAHPEVAEPYDAFLKGWEAAHPKAPHTPYKQALSAEEEEQLKAIGYVE